MKALQFSVTVPQYAALRALGRISRRLYFDSPLATVRLVDVSEPTLPSDEWLKIRTFLCGFCGSDMNLILLKDSPMATPFTSFPCTIGHEFSGELVEVGRRVTGFQVGDAVTVVPTLSCTPRGISPVCRSCQMGRPGNCENFARGDFAPGMFTGICRDIGGGFAPYVVAHGSQVFRLPDGVSTREGAMMEPLAVAVQAVLDNMPEDGDEVLVAGGGVIGNLLVQTMRALGVNCPVTVAEPSPFHAELALGAGANNVITDRDILGHTPRLTGATSYKPMLGRPVLTGGFSRIFDTVASTETLDDAMRALRTNGTLSIVGISRDSIRETTTLWLKLQTIKGVYCYGYVDVNGERKHVFELALDLVKQKKVDVGSMITHEFALDEYRRMIEVNLNKAAHRAVKTVVVFP